MWDLGRFPPYQELRLLWTFGYQPELGTCRMLWGFLYSPTVNKDLSMTLRRWPSQSRKKLYLMCLMASWRKRPTPVNSRYH